METTDNKNTETTEHTEHTEIEYTDNMDIMDNTEIKKILMRKVALRREFALGRKLLMREN